MQLDLLVEDTTPEDVINGLVKDMGIHLPFITIGEINRYALSEEKIMTYSEIEELRMRTVREQGEFKQIIPDIDVVLFREGQKKFFHYNLLRLICEHSPQDNMLLVGTHHGFFHTECWGSHPTCWRVELSNPPDGIWFYDYNAGVVTLKTSAVYENSALSIHELGHGIGLKDHRNGFGLNPPNCIMTQGINGVVKEQDGFCDYCTDLLMKAS